MVEQLTGAMFSVVFHTASHDTPLLTQEAPLPLPVPRVGDFVTLHDGNRALSGQVERMEWTYRPNADGRLTLQTDVWLTRMLEG